MRFAVLALAASLALVAFASSVANAPAQPAPGQVSGATVTLPASTPPQASIEVPISSPSGATTVTVSGGTLIGQLILWVSLVAGVPLAAFAVRWLMLLAKKLGVDVTDANRARLQEMIENGIALAAKNAEADLKGKLPVEVKNQIAAQAIAYAKDHGVDTMKAMGMDPTDPKSVEALEARVAKVLNDLAPPPPAAPPSPPPAV